MILDLLTQLLHSYRYSAIVLLVMMESFGVPVPGEATLLLAAAFAASGGLSIKGVVLAAAIGSIVGDSAGYWIGRVGGVSLIRHWGLNEARLDSAQAFYGRDGWKIVFFGRFIALWRTWAAIFAGAGRMNYALFLLFNALGGICWAVLIGLLGCWLSAHVAALHRIVGRVGLLLALLGALCVALVLGWQWVKTHPEHLLSAASYAKRWFLNLGPVQYLMHRHPRLVHFFGERLSPSGYLGLHLTLGLVLSIIALMIFADIVDDVRDREDLARFDVTTIEAIHHNATTWGIEIAKAVTFTGSVAWTVMLGLLVAALLYRKGQQLMVAGWTVALAGTGVLDEGLKWIIRRPRPQWESPFVVYPRWNWSFPSGHASGSMVAYGMLGYLLVIVWIHSFRWRAIVVTLAATWVLAIGFSRIYLGVHYLTDVMGGFAVGSIWLTACITGLEVARRKRELSLKRA